MYAMYLEHAHHHSSLFSPSHSCLSPFSPRLSHFYVHVFFLFLICRRPIEIHGGWGDDRGVDSLPVTALLMKMCLPSPVTINYL